MLKYFAPLRYKIGDMTVKLILYGHTKFQGDCVPLNWQFSDKVMHKMNFGEGY